MILILNIGLPEHLNATIVLIQIYVQFWAQ